MRWDELKEKAADVIHLCNKGDVFGEVRIEKKITWSAVTHQQDLSRFYSTARETIHVTLYTGERRISLFVPGDQSAALHDLLRRVLPRGGNPPWIEQVERKGCSLHIEGECSPEESLGMVEQALDVHKDYRIGESARCGHIQKAYMNTMGAESECLLPFSEYNTFVRGGKIDFYYSGYVHRPPHTAQDMQDRVRDYVERICGILPAAQKVTPQSCPIVMDVVPFSVIIHEVFGHLLEYDLAVKCLFTADDRGTPIAPESITIRDVPCIKNYFYVPFDDEGTVGKEALLVERGVLKEFLVDRKTAHVSMQSPQGASRAEDATVFPMIRSRTTVLEGGTHTIQELLEEAEGGLYLYGVYRVDAHPDGTFTLGVPLAYNITHGELGDPFYGIKISGNLFDFLKKMTALGKESTFQISHCSKGTGGSVQNVKVGAVVPAAAFTEWNVECDVP